MSELLNRFSFQFSKLTVPVLAALGAIWMVILICTISSILTQPFSKTQRLFWIAIVVLVPFAGVLAYLPFSIKREDLPQIFLAKPKPRPKRGLKSSASGGR